jgi:hypothetical protein
LYGGPYNFCGNPVGNYTSRPRPNPKSTKTRRGLSELRRGAGRCYRAMAVGSILALKYSWSFPPPPPSVWSNTEPFRTPTPIRDRRPAAMATSSTAACSALSAARNPADSAVQSSAFPLQSLHGSPDLSSCLPADVKQTDELLARHPAQITQTLISSVEKRSKNYGP